MEQVIAVGCLRRALGAQLSTQDTMSKQLNRIWNCCPISNDDQRTSGVGSGHGGGRQTKWDMEKEDCCLTATPRMIARGLTTWRPRIPQRSLGQFVNDTNVVVEGFVDTSTDNRVHVQNRAALDMGL